MSENPLICPKCPGQTLAMEDIDGVKVHNCEKCGGIWLNKGELNTLVHPLEGDLEYCSIEEINPDRISEFKCPVCPDSQLIKVNFISLSDIVLEYCTKCHGIWLDRGELDAIAAEVEKLQKIPESWEHKIMVFLSKLPF